MRVRNIFILVLAIFSGLSCSEDNPIQSESGDSDIQLIINSDTNTSQTIQLSKSATITKVVVKVSGPGMSQVIKELTLDSGASSASGSVEVPKGNSRTFTVEGIDGNSIVQFNGQTTKDIINDVETVTVIVSWTPPDPVTLIVADVTSTTALLSWTASSEPDFSFYRVLVSTSPQLEQDVNQVGNDITDKNSTSLTITNLSPNTTYYAAVLSVDTELWFSGTLDFSSPSSIVKSFSTPTALQNVDIKYDDNSFEISLVGTEQNESLIVRFTSPSYPAKVVAMDLFIGGTHEFTAAIFDFSTGNFIGGGTVNGINATNLVWASYNLTTLDINVTGDFLAGISYTGPQQSDGFWRPAIGLDQTSSARRSFDNLPQSGVLSLLDDIGFPGNLGVRVTVEISGVTGQTAVLTPDLRLPSSINGDDNLRLNILETVQGHVSFSSQVKIDPSASYRRTTRNVTD